MRSSLVAVALATLLAGSLTASGSWRSDPYAVCRNSPDDCDADFGWYAYPPGDAAPSVESQPVYPQPVYPQPVYPQPASPEDEPARDDEPPLAVPPGASGFTWTGESAVPENFTLTVLRGLSPRAAIALVAPRPRVPAQSVRGADRAIDHIIETLDPERELDKFPQLVTAVRRGPYTLVYEINNYLATGVAARLSARGDATVLYVSADGGNSFSFARGGRVVREFDPVFGDEVTGRPLPQERDLPFGDDDSYQWTAALAFELTRRLTGYRVTPADFDVTSYDVAVGVAP